MEDLYPESSNDPADNCNDDNAYSGQYPPCRFLPISHSPTTTDMLPFGDTADKICPPTTQSIKEYPII